jgi:hypothetical protein
MSRSLLQIAQAPPLETYEQQNLFGWAAWAEKGHPELKDMYAVPNGAFKSKAMAAKFQREGLKPGVPDIVLPHARGGYHALYIEMKRKRVPGKRVELRVGTRPSEEQLDWHLRLRAAGNCVFVAYGWEEARDYILAYLALKSECPTAPDGTCVNPHPCIHSLK